MPLCHSYVQGFLTFFGQNTLPGPQHINRQERFCETSVFCEYVREKRVSV